MCSYSHFVIERICVVVESINVVISVFKEGDSINKNRRFEYSASFRKNSTQ